MWHTAFITLHAASGMVAFVAGPAALPLGRFFVLYRWSLVVMVGFLLLAIATEWAGTETGTLVAFGALVALAAAMVWRSQRAARMLPAHTGGSDRRVRPSRGFRAVRAVRRVPRW